MNRAKSASGSADAKNSKVVDELEARLEEREDELRKARKDVETMKTQAENLAAEYDRMADERNAFEGKLQVPRFVIL